MKIHWGTGVAIVYGAFVILMVGFVISARNVDHSLVIDNYYEEDLAYQSHLDKVANANALATDLQIVQEVGSGSLSFAFPKEMDGIGGEIWLYRPSDTARDVKMPIETDQSNRMTVPTATMMAGRWRIKVQWQSSGKEFYKEQEVYIQ